MSLGWPAVPWRHRGQGRTLRVRRVRLLLRVGLDAAHELRPCLVERLHERRQLLAEARRDRLRAHRRRAALQRACVCVGEERGRGRRREIGRVCACGSAVGVACNGAAAAACGGPPRLSQGGCQRERMRRSIQDHLLTGDPCRRARHHHHRRRVPPPRPRRPSPRRAVARAGRTTTAPPPSGRRAACRHSSRRSRRRRTCEPRKGARGR